MYTLGFTHTPWDKANPIAPGKEIQNYIHTVAKQNGIDKHINYEKQVTETSYSSKTKEWTITILDHSQNPPKELKIRCNFIEVCSGYYDYENPYRPKFEGEEQFKGDIIHPQKWDSNFDYSNKKIVIIGSGATAITLLPNLIDKAEHVTMLQRSPSYILSIPSHNSKHAFLQRFLPTHLAFQLIRWQSILFPWLFYVVCTKYPSFAKGLLLKATKSQLPK